MPEEIHFTKYGEGPSIVLVHGFCESGDIWKPIINSLSHDHQVITPDLPGFGNSPLPDGELTIDAVADILLTFIENNVSPKPVLIGHSLGGYITLSIAERYPHSIESFGLINSTAFEDNEEKKIKRTRIIDFIRKNGKEKFLESFVPGLFYDPSNKAFEQPIRLTMNIALETSEETMISYTEAMKNRPSRKNVLKQTGIRKLFLAGEQDVIVPREDSLEQINVLREGYGNILSNCGHMSFLENPVAVIQEVRKFLSA